MVSSAQPPNPAVNLQLGYLIHPYIPSSSPTLKIADVGAGTGVDLAHYLPPTCTFRGFDISAAQFPPAATWPKNLTLYTNSILSPFPEPELGTYDLVNVRFMVTVLSGKEWDTAVTNLRSLLKPGGWLQWIDMDASPARIRTVQSVPGASRKACLEAVQCFVEFGKLTNREFDGC